MYLSKNYMMPIFLQMAIAWAKQAEWWKNFLWLTFLPETATQRQVINFFYHHDLAKILLTSMC